MPPKLRIFPLLLLLLALSPIVFGGYCSEELLDNELQAHVVVSSCRNIGTFSVGGLYEGSWEKLSYFYPKPWEGTFFSIYLNGVDYANSMNPKSMSSDKKKMMDYYVREMPKTEGNRIKTVWLLPGEVEVEESFSLIANGTLLEFTITNKGSKAAAVGLRLTLDTMLGWNDGAPIYVPGDGLKSREAEYSGSRLDFRYWKAYNLAENATVVASGVLYGGELTYPDRFVIADWKKSMYTSWAYTPDYNRTILGDSSVLIYYYPTVILPNETRKISTIYKNGGPVVSSSNKSAAIADITPDKIEGGYLPGENVTLSVDVIAKDIGNKTDVLINVTGIDGKVIYTKNVSLGYLKPNEVYSINFTFNLPETSSGLEGGLNINASLYRGGKRIDRKNMIFSAEDKKSQFYIRDVSVSGSYAEGFVVETELVNTQKVTRGELHLSILMDGKIVYESIKDTGVVPQYSRKSINFSWQPEEKAKESIYAIVALYQHNTKLDEASAPFPNELLTGKPATGKTIKEKGKEATEEADEMSLLWILIILLLLFISFVFWFSKRGPTTDISFEKLREGGNIVLIVKNNSRREIKNCVVEDNLPEGIEVSISDLHVIGKGNRLIVSGKDKLLWCIGKLDVGDTAVLEYKLRGSTKLLKARLRWEGGEKTT